MLFVLSVECNQHVLLHVCTSSLTLDTARFYNYFGSMKNWAIINQLGATYIKGSYILRHYDTIAVKLLSDARNTKLFRLATLFLRNPVYRQMALILALL